MNKEEAIKTLKENSCSICSYCAKNMESCSIAYCDNRAAIRTLEQETCEDAVSREAILKEIPRLWNSSGDKDYCMETLRDFVVELLPVTPKGVTVTDFADKCKECGKMKNGKWILNETQDVQAVGYKTYHCSECGREIISKYHGKISLLKEFPYCHCGTKMWEIPTGSKNKVGWSSLENVRNKVEKE